MNRWISGVIPGTPPSVNTIPLDTRSHAYRRARAEWFDLMHAVTFESGNVLPKRLARVRAHAILTFPTTRRRDEGNYRTHLEKWLGDLLQHQGRLVDDTPEFYAFDRVTFVRDRHETTTLVLDYEIGEAVA